MESKTPTTTAAAERGAAFYDTWQVYAYDMMVLGFINSFGWCCPTNKHLLPLFQANIRSNHLDIGVGTGYYHKFSSFPGSLTLCDLSVGALEMAKARSGVDNVKVIRCDITQELPTDEVFDSISMFYLLHCLPGPIENKTAVIERVLPNLASDGVLTGATILGKGVTDGFIGRLWRNYVNGKGYLDNSEDDAQSFIDTLNDNFEDVETKVVGAVLVFKAERPKSAKRKDAGFSSSCESDTGLEARKGYPLDKK
ncbi:hypothetical protein BBP40_011184 [Aspergillus hancockii]|nr:hypothetical protein BBP40_011184 [Aspergillus hancockii]